jgi:hypothetical protein
MDLNQPRQDPLNLSSNLKSDLSYQGIYTCPICRHGQISGLILMDAFACNFCRHIFTANLNAQSLRLEDSPQSVQWRWTSRGWKPLQSLDKDVTLAVWLMAIALLILPPGLIGLSYHTFPPLPDSTWSSFPLVWTATSFALHALLVLWLLLEHHQFGPYVSLRLGWQRWPR